MNRGRSMCSTAGIARHRHRRGFTLVESTVAVVLLVVAMTTTLKALSWVARDRQALDRRAVAIQEAENLLGRLTAGLDAPPSLSPEAMSSLPDGTIEVDRRLESLDGLELERIAVTVRYRDRPGMPAAPVRLTTWVIPSPAGPEEGSR